MTGRASQFGQQKEPALSQVFIRVFRQIELIESEYVGVIDRFGLQRMSFNCGNAQEHNDSPKGKSAKNPSA